MSDKIPASAEEIRKAKILRRTGYVIFGSLALYIAVPMVIGAVSGLMSGDIWDPYTGQHLSERQSAERWCFDEASRLMQQAGTMDKLSRKWDEPARQWRAKCRDAHPDLHQALVETRSDLKRKPKLQQ